MRTYFLRGHSNWFAYVFSLLNFVTISFYLLIENLTVIPDSFRLRHYILIFVLFYAPLAITVGYYDMKKGTYRVEAKIAKELSPIWKDLFDQLDELKTGQKQIYEELQIKRNE
ncbi:MAG: hypothetical protein ACXAD7_00480 [Candidatus Kariarchaeaceae archaeon]|jgi:hypothetical protein